MQLLGAKRVVGTETSGVVGFSAAVTALRGGSESVVLLSSVGDFDTMLACINLETVN